MSQRNSDFPPKYVRINGPTEVHLYHMVIYSMGNKQEELEAIVQAGRL